MAEQNEKRQEEADELDAFLEGLGGGGGKVKLYRANPDTGRQEYVTTYGPDVDLETVQDTYGGGAFQFRAYAFTENGQEYRGARTVHIAGPPKKWGKASPDDETREDRIRRLEEERDELRHKLEMQGLEQRFDSFRTEMLGLIRELRNPPPGANDRNPMELAMELVRHMNAMRPHVETPPPDRPDIMEILRLGLELGQGSAGDSSPYERILDRLAPALNGLFGAAGSRPMTLPAGAQPGAATPGGQPMDLRHALAMWVPYLSRWAAEGKDPNARASAVWDQLPPLWQQELDEFLVDQGGSAITTLLGWYPELSPHRAWLAAFLEGLQPYEEEDDEPARAGNGPVLGTFGPGGQDATEDDQEADPAD